MNVRIVGVYDSDQVSSDNGYVCEGESLTRQEFAEECDINTIIDRFGIGELPIPEHAWVTNIDIANAPDNYQAVMNQLNEARDQFMSLPAKVRSQFDNDPHKFVNFMSDSEKNFDEIVRLGLAKVREPGQPSDTDRIIAALEKRPAQSSS